MYSIIQVFKNGSMFPSQSNIETATELSHAIVNTLKVGLEDVTHVLAISSVGEVVRTEAIGKYKGQVHSPAQQEIFQTWYRRDRK